MTPLSPALKKFLSYAYPYRWWIGVATICGLLKYNIPVVFPWVLKDVIDYLLTTPEPNLWIIHRSMFFLIVMYVIWAIVTYYRSHFADRASQRMIFDVRHDLWVHLQKMWIGFYEQRRVGSISTRLLADTAIAQNFVGAAFTNTVMDLSSLVLIAVLLFSMNWQLALVAVSVLPVYVVINKLWKRRILKTSKLAQQKMEQISGDVHEKLGGMVIIQSYNLEKAEELDFFQDSREHLFYRLANIRNNAAAAAIIGFLTSIAPVAVIWFGAREVVRGHLSVGELTAFYAYLSMFYQPLNRLSDLNIMIANSLSAIDRLYEVFTTSPEIQDRPGALTLTKVRGDIRFSDVSFRYAPEQDPVLRNIDLKIPAGSITALVGQSGAGKSTFIKLIPRFYDVTDGAVTIDGVDIRQMRLRSLRRHTALVPQEPILFSGTINENIIMGRPSAELEEIREAAIAANAHEFISQLPQGYETEIGEDGVKLSGGQRQRIALARAFIKDAPILILDEATSALDSATENLVQEALKRLMRGRTTLIIAHRLSTILSADRIVVFQSGQVVETGKHDELLERPDGAYRKLYEEQFQRPGMEE